MLSSKTCPLKKSLQTIHKIGKYCFGAGAIGRLLRKAEVEKSIVAPGPTIKDILALNNYDSIEPLVQLFRKITSAGYTTVNVENETIEQTKILYSTGKTEIICRRFYNSLIQEENQNGNKLNEKAEEAINSTNREQIPNIDNNKLLNKRLEITLRSALCEIGFYYCVTKKLGISDQNLIPVLRKIVAQTSTIKLSSLKRKTYYFNCVKGFCSQLNNPYNIDKMVHNYFYYDEKTNTIVTSLLFTQAGESLLGTGICPILGLTYKNQSDKLQSCYKILFETLEEVIEEHDSGQSKIIYSDYKI